MRTPIYFERTITAYARRLSSRLVPADHGRSRRRSFTHVGVARGRFCDRMRSGQGAAGLSGRRGNRAAATPATARADRLPQRTRLPCIANSSARLRECGLAQALRPDELDEVDWERRRVLGVHPRARVRSSDWPRDRPSGALAHYAITWLRFRWRTGWSGASSRCRCPTPRTRPDAADGTVLSTMTSRRLVHYLAKRSLASRPGEPAHRFRYSWRGFHRQGRANRVGGVTPPWRLCHSCRRCGS